MPPGDSTDPDDLEQIRNAFLQAYLEDYACLAEAAVEQPEGTIKEVLFPVVGEHTLEALVKEYHSKGPVYRRYIHTLIRRSYSHHYRRMLPLILDTLTFRSNNDRHQPIIEALTLHLNLATDRP